MSKDIHREAFDEGTLTKLDIFERYLKEWLPVFIEQRCSKIFIVDFFAGPGKDKTGQPGSPLRIIENILLYKEKIESRKIQMEVIFNELDERKYKELNENIEAVKDKTFYTPRIYQEDFRDIFYKLKSEFVRNPVLIFMDQNGIRQVTQDILTELDRFQRTDFLFFISSSFFFRFCDDPSFKQYFPGIEKSDLRSTDYNSVHRKILEHYKKMLSSDSSLRLIPFSIKKSSHIYGLIFGTNHILGADKFLNITWNLNKINGEANFDIDDDLRKKEQGVLFEEFKKNSRTKLDEFRDDMVDYVSRKKIVTNKEIYNFTLDNGFIHLHACDVVRTLINEKKLKKICEGKGLFIGYKQCYKENVVMKFEWVQK